MNEVKHNPVIRWLPSFTDLAFLMPIVFFLRRGGGPSMIEGDTGWHIRAGEWMLANGRVPDRDIFSYTKPGEPWFAWEWLWDVIFAWLHQRGGMNAVVLVSLLVVCVTFAMVFRLARRKSGNVLLAAVLTILATVSSSMHWLARPHLFTLLFVIVFYSLLERTREGRMKLLWLLPALTVLWTNLHGGFIVGIVLIATYAAGEFVAWFIETDRDIRKQALDRGRHYALAALGCLAASLANPYSYKLHVHIVRYLGDPYQWNHINEFQPLNFRHGAAIFFEPLVVLGVMAVFWNLHKRRYTDALLVAGWIHLALMAIRNLPILVILATPVLALAAREWMDILLASGLSRRVTGFFEWLSETERDFHVLDRPWRTHAVSVGAAVAILLFFRSAPAEMRARFDAEKYPVAAVDSLAGTNGKIFTHDEWGDYLIYRLYPVGRVYVDGRSDFYGAEFCEKYIHVMEVKRDWEKNLERYGVDILVLPVDEALAAAAERSPRWRCTHRDKTAAVFRSAQVSAVSENDGKDCGREVAQLKHSGREAVQAKDKSNWR